MKKGDEEAKRGGPPPGGAAPGFSAGIGKRSVVEASFVENTTGKRICIRVLRMLLAQEVRESVAGKRICIQARHALTLENIERGFTSLETTADNYEKLVPSRTRCRRSTATDISPSIENHRLSALCLALLMYMQPPLQTPACPTWSQHPPTGRKEEDPGKGGEKKTPGRLGRRGANRARLPSAARLGILSTPRLLGAKPARKASGQKSGSPQRQGGLAQTVLGRRALRAASAGDKGDGSAGEHQRGQDAQDPPPMGRPLFQERPSAPGKRFAVG